MDDMDIDYDIDSDTGAEAAVPGSSESPQSGISADATNEALEEKNVEEEVSDPSELFDEVRAGLRKAQPTVLYLNAVNSFKAALIFIDSEGAQSFIDECFHKIIEILLDQIPSKPNVDKNAVVASLETAVRICVKQLQKQKLQAIDSIATIFDHSRDFYSGKRNMYMHKEYPGLPGKHDEHVRLFGKLHGFEALLNVVQNATWEDFGFKRAKALLVMFKNFRPQNATVSGNGTLNPSVVAERHFAQLNLEGTKGFIFELCNAIMKAVEALSDEELKKQPTDKVAPVVQRMIQLRESYVNCVMKQDSPEALEEANQAKNEGFQFWLRLTSKYLKSASLPQRLFAMDQFAPLNTTARRSKPIPPQFTVCGAGTTFVNGLFTRNGAHNSVPKWTRKVEIPASSDNGAAKVITLTLFRCTLRSGSKYWYLSEADEQSPGTEKDIDYYSAKSSEQFPPKVGWQKCSDGMHPPPILEDVKSKDAEETGKEKQITKQDLMVQWVKEAKVLEDVFGPRIHREIVARCGPLLQFLVDVGGLRASDLTMIWRSILDKTGNVELAKEVYGLIASTTKHLPGSLLESLLNDIHEDLGDGSEERPFTNHYAAVRDVLAQISQENVQILMLKGTKPTQALVRLLWSFTQHPSSIVTSDMKKFGGLYTSLSGQFADLFENAINCEAAMQLRTELLDHCMGIISKSSKVLNAKDVVSCEKSIIGSVASGVKAAKLEGCVLRALELVDRVARSANGLAQQDVLVKLQDDYRLIALLFDEILAFKSRLHGNRTGKMAGLQSRLNLVRFIFSRNKMMSDVLIDVDDFQDSIEDGAGGAGGAGVPLHDPSVDGSLLRNCPRIGNGLVDRLWSILDSKSEREVLMRWLSEAGVPDKSAGMTAAFTKATRQHIFKNLLCGTVEPSDIDAGGYACFETYFLVLNAAAKRLQAMGQAGGFTSAKQKRNKVKVLKVFDLENLEGIDFLWRLALEGQGSVVQGSITQSVSGNAPAVSVAQGSTDLLLGVYQALDSSANAEQGTEAAQKDFIQRIMRHLNSEFPSGLLDTDGARIEGVDLSEAQLKKRAKRLARKNSKENASFSEVQQNSLKVQRCLSLMLSYVKSSKTKVRSAHGASGRGKPVKVHIRARKINKQRRAHSSSYGSGTGVQNTTQHLEDTWLILHNKETVASLRKKIATFYKHTEPRTRLLMGGKQLYDRQTVESLNVTGGETIIALLVNSDMALGALQDESDGEGTGVHPGLVIAKDNKSCNTLFRVLDNSTDDKTAAIAWDLLMTIPTNENLILQAMKPDELDWESSICDTRFYKSIYILQIFDALLLPGDDRRLGHAATYRKKFLESNGFQQVQQFLMNGITDGTLKSAFEGNKACLNGVQIVLRIIKFFLLCATTEETAIEQIYGLPVTFDDESRKMILQGIMRKDMMSKLVTIAATKGTAKSSSATATGNLLCDAMEIITSIIEASSANVQGDSSDVVESFFSTPRMAAIINDVLPNHQSTAVREAAAKTLSNICSPSLSSNAQRVHVIKQLVEVVAEQESNSSTCMQCFSLMETLIQQSGDGERGNKSDAALHGSLEGLVKTLIQRLDTCPKEKLESKQSGSIYSAAFKSHAMSSSIGPKTKGRAKYGKRTNEPVAEKKNIFLVGSLRLLSSLLNVHPELQKVTSFKQNQSSLIERVFDTFLFSVPTLDNKESWPLCRSEETRTEAFTLLRTLIENDSGSVFALLTRINDFMDKASEANGGNLKQVAMRAGGRGSKTDVWSMMSTADIFDSGGGAFELKESKFAGLKNQGCTCYMNALLQQLYCLPEWRDEILASKGKDFTKEAKLRELADSKIDIKSEPEEIVGRKVSVRWASGSWYTADVENYDAETGFHSLKYADGEKNEYNMLEGRPEFETPEYRVLPAPAPAEEANAEVLDQLQRTFRYLKESQMRYFDPLKLVESCATLRLEHGIHQQNDAGEFWFKLLDRVEESLKHSKKIHHFEAISDYSLSPENIQRN
jgi:ubiquitin carboxyl-terminal hydrolase 9/24